MPTISVSFFFHSLRKLLWSPHDQQCSFSYTEYTDYKQPLRACYCRKSARARARKAWTAKRLNNALIEHRIGDFDEACDVRTDDEITRLAVFLGSFP